MTTLDLRRVRPALRRWSRSARAYWFGVIIISVGAGALTWTWLHRAETLARSWGTSRTVLVAATDIAAGSPVADTVLVPRKLPLAALPEDALPEDALAGLPAGAVATVRLSGGTIITPAMLDAGGGSAIARRLSSGQRAVSMRSDEVALPVSAGDHVVVYAAPADAPAIIVTASATVLSVDDTVVTVSVPLADTAAAIDAVAARTVQLALVGRDP